MFPTVGPIAVLGLNARGMAIAAALAHAGAEVVVSDLADSADSSLIPDSVTSADSVDAALAATSTGARLLVLCAEDYGVLEQLPSDSLSSLDIVNVTSGTSEQAQQIAARVEALGGRYLDGALMAHPEQVGRAETVLVYSGSDEVFRRRESVLATLGRTIYLGSDAGIASLYDVAMLNFAWATLLGYIQAATLLATAGISAATVTPMMTDWLKTTVVEVIDEYAGQIDARSYPGDEEWLELDAPLMEHLIQATEERGLDAALPRLIESITAKGITAGHGKESFASLTEVLRQ